MGLFSFVKNAGAKIFGFKGEEEKTAEANTKKEQLIKDFAARFELVEDFSVVVDGDKATLRGTATSQTNKEKLILAVGNIEGIATVEDLMTVETPEPESQFYTVVSGDSLSKIAKKYYGNAMKYPEIFEANKPMLKDPNLIYPGQVLRIPPLD